MSKAGSVSIKSRRDKLALYIGLPGEPDTARFNLALGLDDNKGNENYLKKDVIPVIKSHMVLGNWQALHDLYPGCVQFAAKLPRGEGLTMDVLFDRMVRNWEDKGRHSLKDMLSKLKEVRAFFAGKRVCDVDFDMIQKFLDGLRERVGPATANRKRAQIVRAFNYAFKKQWITERPAFPDAFDEPEPRQVKYTEAEVDLLIATVPERLKGVVEIASITGWRLEAVLSRKWRTDVDYETVHPDHADIAGVLHLDALHSKNHEPMMFPLTPRLRAVLEKQIAWVKALELSTGQIIPWLFPNDDKRHKVGGRMKRINKALYHACDQLGLNIDPNTGKTRVHAETGKVERRWFHDFRRTAQEHMEKSGLSDSEQMELIGHKTVSMHERYRGKTTAKRVAGIGSKLAAAEAALLERKGNVVPFVPPACHTPSVQDLQNAEGGKKAVNARVSGWAGSESNTRHKDFQS